MAESYRRKELSNNLTYGLKVQKLYFRPIFHLGAICYIILFVTAFQTSQEIYEALRLLHLLTIS